MSDENKGTSDTNAHAPAVTATCSASTRVGVYRFRRFFAPSPSCPCEFAPHTKTAPPWVAAIECASPHEMRVTGLPSRAVTRRGARSCAGDGGIGGKNVGNHTETPSASPEAVSPGRPCPSWPRRPSPQVHTSQLHVRSATCARPAATATICRRCGLSARRRSIACTLVSARSVAAQLVSSSMSSSTAAAASSSPLPPSLPSEETRRSPLTVRRNVLGQRT